MRKRVIKILIVVIGLFTIGFIYINSSFFIEKQEWKYAEGTHIGDWLNKSNMEINDRIIYSFQRKAKIVFSTGSSLVIENIETKERGIYINKS
ncbi:hypothetical protein [Hwangdonia sp.]|uniref:hypothetical protein n=1 Tax=Hwangdonia sp. TaxID=1883432 RepID=UPI003AB1C7F6